MSEKLCAILGWKDICDLNCNRYPHTHNLIQDYDHNILCDGCGKKLHFSYQDVFREYVTEKLEVSAELICLTQDCSKSDYPITQSTRLEEEVRSLLEDEFRNMRYQYARPKRDYICYCFNTIDGYVEYDCPGCKKKLEEQKQARSVEYKKYENASNNSLIGVIAARDIIIDSNRSVLNRRAAHLHCNQFCLDYLVMTIPVHYFCVNHILYEEAIEILIKKISELKEHTLDYAIYTEKLKELTSYRAMLKANNCTKDANAKKSNP